MSSFHIEILCTICMTFTERFDRRIVDHKLQMQVQGMFTLTSIESRILRKLQSLWILIFSLGHLGLYITKPTELHLQYIS